MESKIFLSVIIPAYNTEKYIEKCLLSICNQTFKDIEIIVIDDGSKDNTGKICDDIAQRDSRIIVKHEKNSGVVSSRKKGSFLAKGDYITFVDSDDWIESDYYEKVYNAIVQSKEKIDCVITELYEWNYKQSDKLIEYTQIDYGIYDKKGIQEYIVPNMMCDNYSFRQKVSPTLYTKVMRRELLIQNIKNCDEMITLGDDAAVSYFVIFDSNAVIVLNYAGYNYRDTPMSMTKASDIIYYERLEHFYNYIELCIKEKNANSIQTQYDLYALYLFWRQLKIDILNDKLKQFIIKAQTPALLSVLNKLEIKKIDCDRIQKYELSLLKARKYYALRTFVKCLIFYRNIRKLADQVKRKLWQK